MENLKEEVKEKLHKLSDEKYKKFHTGLCPGVDNILGIRVPILRNYAKELKKEYNLEDLIQNIDEQYYEEIMLKGMIIGLENKKDFDTIKGYIKNFVPKIDNWAICDTFCAGLKITKKYEKEMWEFIKIYLKSKNEFEVRFAIVMILDYYIKEEYIKQDFKIFENTKSDKYYIQMAVAWAISICFIKFYNETKEFMKNSSIEKFTYNKAIQKAIESYRITEEQKEELRKLKKNM
ncbi:MAG: DNA alkylation repair protein [Clostridia bacterium]|nr:DNA alkylation repair protein [Clostridium sp.]